MDRAEVVDMLDRIVDGDDGGVRPGSRTWRVCEFRVRKPRPSVTLYGPALPSRDKTAEVEVFQTQRPERPYLEIARIETNHGDDAWGMKQILVKARELGTDGVILLGSTHKSVEQVPVEGQHMTVAKQYGISAIATRFR